MVHCTRCLSALPALSTTLILRPAAELYTHTSSLPPEHPVPRLVNRRVTLLRRGTASRSPLSSRATSFVFCLPSRRSREPQGSSSKRDIISVSPHLCTRALTHSGFGSLHMNVEQCVLAHLPFRAPCQRSPQWQPARARPEQEARSSQPEDQGCGSIDMHGSSASEAWLLPLSVFRLPSSLPACRWHSTREFGTSSSPSAFRISADPSIALQIIISTSPHLQALRPPDPQTSRRSFYRFAYERPIRF